MNRECVPGQAERLERETGEAVDAETPQEEMDPGRLSPRQMLALTAFHRGATLTAAAEAAGVSRQTLHRWRARHRAFGEAMQSWEAAQITIARSRLADLASDALDAVADAILTGNTSASLMVLKTLRILQTFKPVDARQEEERRAAESQIMLENVLTQPKEVPTRPQSSAVAAGGFAAKQPVVGEAASAPAEEQAGRPHHNGNGKATTVPPAKHAGVASRGFEGQKPAILNGKAGLAIHAACYGALQNVTKFDGTLQRC